MAHPETTPSAPGTFHLTTPRRLNRGQGIAGLVAVGVLALAGVWTLHGFLPAIGWATILAVSLWPLKVRAEQMWPRVGRNGWPAIFTVVVALFFVLPLVLVVEAVIADGAGVMRFVAQARAQGVPVPGFLGGLPYGSAIAGWWQAHLATPEGIAHLHVPVSTGGARGRAVIGAIFHRVLLATFMVLILFFFLRDGDRIARALRIGCERAFGDAGLNVAAQALRAVRGTVNGLVLVGFGEGVIMGIAYALAGAPHAALLGVLTALLSPIPLGATLAVAVAVALLLAQGSTVAAIVVGVFGGVLIFVADHFIRPVMIGDATRLPFLWVLLGILGGIETWGLIGLVVGPALIAVVTLLWREYVGSQAGPLNPGDEEVSAEG